jgi:aspartate aminotransferase
MLTYNRSLDRTPLSVFDDLEKRIAAGNHPHFIKLHQGKTTFTPCVNLLDWQPNDFDLEAHQHASPQGIPSLRKTIVEKLSMQYQIEINEDNITITCGSTHGIGTALRAMLNPGDEVLIMSPQWLFASGLVYAAGGIPIEVPVFLELTRHKLMDITDMLEVYITSKTKAIYFNTPNNPTGVSLGINTLHKLAEFAEKHDLYLISDNAYEIYDFTEQGFIDIAQLPEATARTFSVYTFSKTYAMPGYRVGYVLSPAKMAERIRKYSLYSIYSVSTASQYGAFKALNTPSTILARHHEQAKQARDITAAQLKIPSTPVQGGFYTLLDLSDWEGGDVEKFITLCIEEGVSVAPGIAFGKACETNARICFVAVGHDDLCIGIKRLNRVYDSGT